MGGQIDETLIDKANAWIKAEVNVASFPATFWQTTVNMQPGYTWITIPAAGDLWVYYSWSQEPAQEVFVWHQGGSSTPIQPGENTIAVGAGDVIIYSLVSPAVDSIKLAYQLI